MERVGRGRVDPAFASRSIRNVDRTGTHTESIFMRYLHALRLCSKGHEAVLNVNRWHHSIPRHIAERFLAKHGEGSFLVRRSSVGERLVLSSMIRTKKEGLDYDHHIIEETGVDGEMCALGAGIVGEWSRANPFVRYFSLQFQSDQKHRSLAELISNVVAAKVRPC